MLRVLCGVERRPDLAQRGIASGFMDVRPFWLAGRPATGDAELTVTNPYDGRVVGVRSRADRRARSRRPSPPPHAVRRAGRRAARARAGRGAGPRVAPAGRAGRGDRPADHRRERQADAAGRAARSAGRSSTFRFAAEEARRWSAASVQRLDTEPAAAGRMAYVVPRCRTGPVLGDHAVQLPAQPGGAQGRPGHRGRRARSSSSPRRRRRCPRCCSARSWPRPTCPRACSRCCRCPTTGPPALVAGPAAAGGLVHRLRRRSAARSRTGCRASTSRWSSAATPRPWCCADADLDWAAQRIALFSNYQAGQSCIAVQRVIVEDAGLRRVRRQAASPAVDGLVTGDPCDDKTQVGPLVSRGRRRAGRGVGRRGRRGGRAVLTGGTREGADDRADRAGRRARRRQGLPRGGLRAGAGRPAGRRRSTRRSPRSTTPGTGCRPACSPADLDIAFRAHRELEVGGVIIGDVPVLPGRPDAVRRRQGVGRRPRGLSLGDGGLHLREGHGADRAAAVARFQCPARRGARRAARRRRRSRGRTWCGGRRLYLKLLTEVICPCRWPGRSRTATGRRSTPAVMSQRRPWSRVCAVRVAARPPAQ